MKKILFFIAVIIITVFFINNKDVSSKNIETRGVFISYIEYEKYFSNKSNKEIEDSIISIIDSLDKYYLNTIYLQVRMFSDSIYPSKIFPFTDIIDNRKDTKEIDILGLFLKYAHKKKIKLYAWINPYRISTNTDISKIKVNSPAYIYLNTNHVKVVEDKGIYYNPASSVVKNLVLAGIFEIINNYKVDGIVFDDYFYPSDDIDLENYEEYKNVMSISEFRLSHVNDLIERVYSLIKSVDQNIMFGISPDGNINNNYDTHYADIKTWLSKSGYIDFIMPQLYYGFNNSIKPYISTLNEWNDLIKNDVKLIVALALYKAGNIDTYAKDGKNEWIDSDDIIKREIEVARKVSHYTGYSIYRYDYLINGKNTNMQNEVGNYLELLKK